MKAVVRESIHPRRMKYKNIRTPTLGNSKNHAIIKVAYAGICGRDIEHFNSKLSKNKIPYVPGHEFSGTIYKLPNNYKGKLKVGNKVVCETVAYVCNKCPICKSGYYNLCKKRKNIGGSSDGAFSEFVKTPIKYIHQIPKNIELTEAALIEPLCVCYNALINNSKNFKKGITLIIGSGTIGLLTLVLAKYLKIKVVLLTHPSDKIQVKIAKKIGVNFVYYSEKKAFNKIMSLTRGLGCNLVVDTVGGVNQTIEFALKAIAPGGQITKIGWFMNKIDVNFDTLIRKNVSLQGSFSHNYEIWEKCIKLLSQKKITIKDIITNIYSLNKWDEAYNLLEERKALKILLKPN